MLSGAAGLPKPLRKAAKEDHFLQPISEMAIKLHAYRGDEPGIGHRQAEMPNVTRQEAELILNVAGAVGNYLKSALTGDAAA